MICNTAFTTLTMLALLALPMPAFAQESGGGGGERAAAAPDKARLSEEQQRKFHDLHTKLMIEAVDLKAAVDKAHLLLASVMHDDAAPADDVLAAVDALNAAKSALFRHHVQGLIQVRDLLGAGAHPLMRTHHDMDGAHGHDHHGAHERGHGSDRRHSFDRGHGGGRDHPAHGIEGDHGGGDRGHGRGGSRTHRGDRDHGRGLLHRLVRRLLGDRDHGRGRGTHAVDRGHGVGRGHAGGGRRGHGDRGGHHGGERAGD